jgi:glyceraldehyde 3-phosphate dehydrogenase
MAIRAGINGFGRIGKLVFRLMQENPRFEVVGINDTEPVQTLAHLLRYDSAHGKFNGDVYCEGENLIVNGKSIPVFHEPDPSRIPEIMGGTKVVIESSGKFVTRESLEAHIAGGAEKVILTCPAADPLDKTVIIGVNEKELNSQHKIVSNASCTANCVAPMVKVLHDGFGLKEAFMNTVHPATNNQRLIDAPHTDLRRSRTALTNIIPTTSTAIPIVWELFPFLKGNFNGLATRVPVQDGSLIELVAKIETPATAQEINNIFKSAASNQMKGIIQYSDEPLVSGDIIGNPHSLLFDSLLTKVLENGMVQLIGWYDNEYGYSNRVVELAEMLGQL